MQKKYPLVFSVTSLFVLLGILFIPFPFQLIGFQQRLTDFLFGPLIHIVADVFLGIQLKNTNVHSDSVSMYVLVLILFVLSVIIVLLLQYVKKWKEYRDKIFHGIYLLACYYLLLLLLKYGLDKIFKSQFYLPEPNTLYTPLGQIDKDLLYWTSMGTSRFYNICTGAVEVLASLFLFFKRTRMAGILLAAAAMVQVALINFGFDISVKLYSLFLLFLSVYLLYPFYKRLWQFFVVQKEAIPPVAKGPVLFKHPFWSVFIKWLAMGFIFLEALYPYIKANNFNDDMAKRPYLHGAYKVQQLISGTDTLTGNDLPVKRFFIHRNGYMIFQDAADNMQDYRFSYDKAEELYVLTDYQQHKTAMAIQYQKADSTITLQYKKEGRETIMTGKALDWRKLPVLQKSFHWTVD